MTCWHCELLFSCFCVLQYNDFCVAVGLFMKEFPHEWLDSPVCFITYCIHRLPRVFVQERIAAKMLFRFGKTRVLISLMCVSAICVLSRSSWNLSSNYLSSQRSSLCACHRCLTDGDPWFRGLVNASPTPFLSRNYTTSEDVFKWFKVNVNISLKELTEAEHNWFCFTANSFRDSVWSCCNYFGILCTLFLLTF